MNGDTGWTVLPAGFGRAPVAIRLRSRGRRAGRPARAGIGAWENEGGNLAPSAGSPDDLPAVGPDPD